MKYLRQLALLSIMVSLLACSTITITTDYALEQDFDGYRSYQWHPDGIDKTASLDLMGGDIFTTRVKRLIEQTIADKGLVKSDTPDFYVNYSVVTEDRVSINTYNTYGGYGPGWGYYGYGGYGGWGGGTTQTSISYYTQGMVIVDIVDVASNKLVWRSTADSRVEKNSTPQQKEQDLRKSFVKMFENFPPSRPKK